MAELEPVCQTWQLAEKDAGYEYVRFVFYDRISVEDYNCVAGPAFTQCFFIKCCIRWVYYPEVSGTIKYVKFDIHPDERN